MAETAKPEEKAKKAPKGIYDTDLDLGYQLKTADAPSLGRDHLVQKQLPAPAKPNNEVKNEAKNAGQ